MALGRTNTTTAASLQRLHVVAALAAMSCACGGSANDSADAAADVAADASTHDSDSGAPGIDGRWFEDPRAGAQIFVSGHSLIDRVFGTWPQIDGGPIYDIAVAAGKDHHSQLQSGPGSTAQLRREDILDGTYETPNWEQFDTLIVLERSDVVSAMIYENGIDALGWFVDNILAPPPGDDELFLYQTWWGNDGNPRVNINSWEDWIDHVRAELPLIECISERVGRARNVHFRALPAGNAVTELVEAALANNADGLRVEDLWEDDLVHLSDTGHIFVSMLVVASVYRTPITGVAIPNLSTSRTALFAEIVDRVVADYYDGYRSPTAAQCRTAMQDMCDRFGETGCDVTAFFGDDVFGDPVMD